MAYTYVHTGTHEYILLKIVYCFISTLLHWGPLSTEKHSTTFIENASDNILNQAHFPDRFCAGLCPYTAPETPLLFFGIPNHRKHDGLESISESRKKEMLLRTQSVCLPVSSLSTVSLRLFPTSLRKALMVETSCLLAFHS